MRDVVLRIDRSVWVEVYATTGAIGTQDCTGSWLHSIPKFAILVLWWLANPYCRHRFYEGQEHGLWPCIPCCFACGPCAGAHDVVEALESDDGMSYLICSKNTPNYERSKMAYPRDSPQEGYSYSPSLVVGGILKILVFLIWFFWQLPVFWIPTNHLRSFVPRGN